MNYTYVVSLQNENEGLPYLLSSTVEASNQQEAREKVKNNYGKIFIDVYFTQN